MGFFRFLGGAALGILAVAALPIAGPIGAVTALGAAAGAAVGGTAASVLDNSEEEAEQRGVERTTAQYDQKYQKIVAAFKDAEQQLKSTSSYFDLLLAMQAVGLACAACDGEIAQTERDDIDEFIAGIAASALPDNVKNKIEKMAANPPNINTAFKLTKKLGLDSYSLFEEIIEVVIHSDGNIHKNEMAFKQAWNELMAA